MLFFKICGDYYEKACPEAVRTDEFGQEHSVLERSIARYNRKIRETGFVCFEYFRRCEAGMIALGETREIIEKNVSGFLSYLRCDVCGLVFEEITFEDFTDRLWNAGREDYIENTDSVKSEFGLDDIRIGKRRFCEIGENLVDAARKDRVEKIVKKTFFARSLIPEIERIYSCPNTNGVAGHPCHYMLLTADEGEVREKACRALLSALYSNSRIRSRRYWYLDFDTTSEISVATLKQYYSACSGGTVVVRFKSIDDKPENDTASPDRRIIAVLCDIIRHFRNDTLTVLCLKSSDMKARSLFYEYLGSLNVYEAAEENASGEGAGAYLKQLCRDRKIRPDANLYKRLDPQREYTAAELQTVFDEWYNKKLKSYVFPQYSDLQRADVVAVEEKDRKGDSYSKLTSLIGLEEAKKVIGNARDFFLAQKLFRDKGFATDRPSLSMVFTGNPGSCKTTVARLVAGIFKESGILPEGNLIECGRGDLVGQYVGWTAVKIKKKFREAKGSVLFIDEAYSLVDDRDGSFGDEAINTIVQEMENHRDDTLVIFAGYPDKMERFLNKNPGLRSRIAFHVRFDDYSAEQLCDIAGMIAGSMGLVISGAARDKLYGIFEGLRESPDFGNGRAARNIIEAARMSMSSRLLRGNVEKVTEEQVRTILPEDISVPQLIRTEPERRAVGF
ncbi:MAG: AAA family ATPase [Clostridia bacterium]|nr:AAA family ATPase [Clostridia bacterium]